MSFPATREEALTRLQAFLPRAGRAYAANRNLDEGPGARTHVSCLSPAIRRRLVSEEEVAKAALAAHGFLAAEKFIQEVCWRTYWRGWLEQRPKVWRDYLAEVDRAEMALGSVAALARRYADAVSGRTGIDAFDAWAAELVATGYLHNHARMNFASIWIFTLGLPWALGAAHFFRHLLDACPASNTLSWRWVAGLQTVGKSYRADPAIIRRTSGGRFRVEAPLAAAAPPLPPGPPAPLLPLPVLSPPRPDVPTGLFLHTEDLSPETMDLAGCRVRAIAAVEAIGGDPAPLKRAYANASLQDGCDRAAVHFGVPVERLPEAGLDEALTAFVARHGLRQILTPFAPVSPVADRIARLKPALAAVDVALVQVMRPWDARAFPHATRGFFPFREKIPMLVGA